MDPETEARMRAGIERTCRAEAARMRSEAGQPCWHGEASLLRRYADLLDLWAEGIAARLAGAMVRQKAAGGSADAIGAAAGAEARRLLGYLAGQATGQPARMK